MIKNTKTHRKVNIITKNGMKIEYSYPTSLSHGDDISINGNWVEIKVKNGADNYSDLPKGTIATFGDIIVSGRDNSFFHIFTPLEWSEITEKIKKELHTDGFEVITEYK